MSIAFILKVFSMKKISSFFLTMFAGTMVTFASFNITTGSWSLSVGNNANGGQLYALVAMAQTIIERLVPLLIGVAVIAFFWYLVVFISKGDESADKRKLGLQGMGYSLIAIFIMVSIWGIMIFISNMLGVGIGGGLPPLEMPKAQ